MNNQNFHPIQKVPPIAHALHHWDEKTGRLCYEYNGVNIITLDIPKGHEIGFRHGSDGTMQSIQYMQQVYVSSDVPVKAVMTITLNKGCLNMRPHRAGREQAILGQAGSPLIAGVNGMYDVDWDLLIDWNGCNWRWISSEFEKKNGFQCAKLEVEFSQKALFINIRPQYYRTHLGYRYHQPWKFQPNPKPIAGWCSWEAYRRNIDIEKVAHISEFMQKNLRDYGLEYIQVDDGYQKMPLPYNAEGTMAEGWLTCEEKAFPQGHKSIVKTIRQHHFTPAVWTNANITNPRFPQCHKNDVVWFDGEPLKGEWIDYLYSCLPECLHKHVIPLFQELKELGYQYIKIDAIRHLLFDGFHECVRLGMFSNEEAEKRFRAYMEATREGMGKDVYYLASWGEMHEVVGVADACRISMDANPTWAGIRMQLFESARWFFTNRILFLNDPDHVCVRTKSDWAKSVLSLISLSGELYMLSDTPDAYTPEKLEIIQKTLPPLPTKTAETGPLSLDYPAYTWTKLHGFAVQSHETPVEMEDITLEEAMNMAGDFPSMDDDHPFSSLWAFHIEKHDVKWCVMARIATMPLKAVSLPLKNLGLDTQKEYHAFDFWQQKYLGIVKNQVQCDALGLGQCQIVAFHEKTGEPQIIASSRHVSMDAVSIESHHYQDKKLILTLNGVVETAETYYLYLPNHQKCVEVTSQQAEISVKPEQGLLAVRVQFSHPKAKLIFYFEEK